MHGFSLVDGGWGDWVDDGECSLTCGGGVISQVRECNNPTPVGDGAVCGTVFTQEVACNEDVCPGNQINFLSF